jgi:hypothetical protein
MNPLDNTPEGPENSREPKPRKDHKGEAPSLPPLDPKTLRVAEHMADAATGTIHARAKLNMLSFLLTQCREAELERRPEDGTKPEPRERNLVELFLLDRSESPLQESEEAQGFLRVLNAPVQSIDESDTRNLTLREIVESESPEKMEEIRGVVENLIQEDTIQERIREILLQSSPELLADYQEYHKAVDEMTREQNLNILLGDDAPDKEKAEFRQLLQAETKENMGWAMLEAEKARLACQALTLPADSPQKEKAVTEAKKALGEEAFFLLESQVQHTNKTIEALHLKGAMPSGEPEELIAPEILARMGEEGPNAQQLKALEEIQEFYLFRRGDKAPSTEELTQQTSRVALASLYVLEHGEWARNVSTLRQYREILQTRDRDLTPLDPGEPAKEPEAPKGAEAPGEPSGTSGAASSPVPESPKATLKAYQEKLRRVEGVIDTYNEGISDDTYRVDKEKLMGNIRRMAGDCDRGLKLLKEEDIRKAGAPPLLAKSIADLLDLDKNKLGGQKSNSRRVISDQIRHLRNKFVGKVYEDVREDLVHEKGTGVVNEGLEAAMKKVGGQAMDMAQ